MVRQGNSGTRGSGPKGSSGAKAGAGRRPARKPLSPVYRRRRLVVGAVLLLVIALAVGGFAAISAALKGPAPAATASDSPQTPGATGGPDPSATPTSTSGAGCDEKLLTVTASTDKAAYGPDESPLLTLKVTNKNRVACEVNIGTSQMEYLVTSGSDRIFSSRDCQAESDDLVKKIPAGRTETANFPWNRKRSTEGCKVVDAQPGGGGAYYVFTARLGNKTSPKAVFQLG